MGKVKKTALTSVLFTIRTYQVLISPLLGHCCRFYPTCSSYAIDAIKKHGILRGLFLSLARILRCHPWSQGGIDLVPEK